MDNFRFCFDVYSIFTHKYIYANTLAHSHTHSSSHSMIIIHVLTVFNKILNWIVAVKWIVALGFWINALSTNELSRYWKSELKKAESAKAADDIALLSLSTTNTMATIYNDDNVFVVVVVDKHQQHLFGMHAISIFHCCCNCFEFKFDAMVMKLLLLLSFVTLFLFSSNFHDLWRTFLAFESCR